MILTMQADGTLLTTVPERVFQGSNNANTIAVVTDIARTNSLVIAFKLPQSGVWTTPIEMTLADNIDEATGFNVWTILLETAMTQEYGSVELQVQSISPTGEVLGSALGSFVVERGVPPTLPATMTTNVYEQILANLSEIKLSLNTVVQEVEELNARTDVLNAYCLYKDMPISCIDLSVLKNTKILNAELMFGGIKKDETVAGGWSDIDFSYLDTSECINMLSMFEDNDIQGSLDLSSLDTSNVTTMHQMFGLCEGLGAINMSDWNTSKVTDMIAMFQGCSKLTTLDLSSFNTSNVTSMSFMFYGCSKLTLLDLSSFVFNARSYSNMFAGVPNDCLIYVKDQTAKDWITSKFTNLTNVQIKGE